MSNNSIAQPSPENPRPIEASFVLDGVTFAPEAVPNTSFTRRILGKVGLGNTVTSEHQRIRNQRKDFLFKVVDRMSSGSYPLDEIPAIQLYEEDYANFGYSIEEFSDSHLNEGFHKENDVALDALKNRDGYDWYRVVEDSSKTPWLIKTANKQTKGGRGLHELYQVSTHLEEVFAYRIGASVGYPVPETKPVFYDGKPWLAFRFVNDHEYHTTDVREAARLSNGEALRTRFIFNALIRSYGDNTTQGIIDPSTSKYYAQDVSVLFRFIDRKMSPEELEVKLEQEFENLDYGTLNDLNDEDREFARRFLRMAQNIDDSVAKEIFAYGRGVYADSEVCLQHIKNRATALLSMLDKDKLRKR